MVNGSSVRGRNRGNFIKCIELRKKGLSYSKKERNIDVLTRSCSHSSKEEKVSFLPKINMKISPQKSIGLKTRSSLCVTTTVDESHILPKIQKMSKFKSDKR